LPLLQKIDPILNGPGLGAEESGTGKDRVNAVILESQASTAGDGPKSGGIMILHERATENVPSLA
jgi:hypothetical protein